MLFPSIFRTRRSTAGDFVFPHALSRWQPEGRHPSLCLCVSVLLRGNLPSARKALQGGGGLQTAETLPPLAEF